MPIKCHQCDQANLESTIVQLTGKVRGEEYAVEMMGLKCPHCSYQTIDGLAMPEYGRLLADRYRAAHGLLTSEDIRKRRDRLGMSQQAFADFLKVGIASVKRWEMGKIQDARNDALIRERTAEPVCNVLAYTLTIPAHPMSTVKCLGDGIMFASTATVEFGAAPNSFALAEQYFTNVVKEPLYCDGCKQTGWAIALPHHQTVPPYIAAFFNYRKERRHYARSRQN